MTLGMFDDSVGSFRLPHAPLSLRSHMVVEAAICAAWRLMLTRARGTFDLQMADEDSITHELYERLYDEVFDKGVVDGFDREIFTSVHREPKIRNFNGMHPDKMPDLFVDFVDRPTGVMNSQHGIFIECKPVDAKHTVGAHYCDKGIIRFVQGDYAWTMQSAMMVAYARAGYAISPKLLDALEARSKSLLTLAGSSFCSQSREDAMSEAVYITKHTRAFRYADSGAEAPAVVIRHLWLKRP